MGEQGVVSSVPVALKVSESNRSIAQALVIQGFSFREVSEKTGLNLRTIQTWARRYGWRKLRDETKREVNQAIVRATGTALSELSTQVREWLAAEVQEQIAALRNLPVKATALANSPKGEGRSSLVKRIADTASVVFDWDDQYAPGIVLIGEIEEADPLRQPFDVSPSEKLEPAFQQAGGFVSSSTSA